ncbi:MAG: hypothetical protein QM728_14400 [Gordonia sp. (in: high G+C Gram-positive bacteria)]|uniref:hypothetical protein n=1 Tax=Gordonia sp. (in: high G+C Gram-positive bacteria) TaxID=84139 RepID=UPI0039E5FED3
MNNTSLTLRRSADGDWLAVDDEARTIGRGARSRRPGPAMFISVDAWSTAAFDLLADAIVAELPSPLHTLADADDVELIDAWRRHGFTERRRSACYRIPFAPPPGTPPPGIRRLPGARIILRGPDAPFVALDVDTGAADLVAAVEALGGSVVETTVELVRP